MVLLGGFELGSIVLGARWARACLLLSLWHGSLFSFLRGQAVLCWKKIV